MMKFRECVDNIQSLQHRDFVKLAYLTAARVSEITTKANRYDMQHGFLKQVYGEHLEWKFEDYVENTIKEKCLILTLATAKRKPLTKDETFVKKVIALPCDPKYEPWTIDLLRRMKTTKEQKLSFDICRATGWNICKRYLKPLDPKVHTHSLRHWRISHLVNLYNFEPYDVVAYAGWTTKTVFGQMGLATGQLDIYLSLSWRKYFPRLLKPIVAFATPLPAMPTQPSA